jgi:hypothetical protein
MGQYSSYYLYQKYEKRGEQDWIPCYPNTFSMSGDSENPMPFVVKTENDPQCGYSPKGSDDYNYEKWEVVDGYICDDTTKYARERKYVSDDNTNWTATDIYRRSTTVLAYNSTDCGYDSQWDNYNCFKWEVVANDYICNEGNKYQKLRKYFRQCDDCDSCSAEWSASNIYKQGEIITYNSTDCGYVVGERMYRWIDLNPLTDYYCEGTTKYYKQQRQVSNNQGETWTNLDEFRKGVLYEEESEDCGYVPPVPIYRWSKAATTDYVCVGYDKHYKEYYQVSYDDGATWQNVVPTNSRTSSDVIEYNSQDCGYVSKDYRWTKTDDTICIEATNQYKLFTTSYPHTLENDRQIPCDASGILSYDIVQSYYYGGYQGWSTIQIGDCVTEIGENTFSGF